MNDLLDPWYVYGQNYFFYEFLHVQALRFKKAHVTHPEVIPLLLLVLVLSFNHS